MCSAANAPQPHPISKILNRDRLRWSRFGCPFECSFCTIINVQGRKSRFRTPNDLEAIVRANAALGISRFLVTDDNFARNKQWEILLDRLILLKEEGLGVILHVQVDTMAHKIPGFIEKVVAAGGYQIFIGLENVNSDNLEAAKKRQNRIEDYREMILAWKKFPVMIWCGYIIGFPHDTKESVLRDVEVIKRYLAIDNIYFNYLTPLPGSEDHKRQYEAGVWMDPDMNKYSLSDRVSHHLTMSDADWEWVYREIHLRYYDFAHMETILRRNVALGSKQGPKMIKWLVFNRESRTSEGMTIMESGFGRIRRRRQRRPGMAIENPLAFYPKHWFRKIKSIILYAVTYVRLLAIMRRIEADPGRFTYEDAAISPKGTGETDALVASTRTTDYARRRISRRSLVEAKTSELDRM
jgi:hypothetical protein